MPTADAGVMGGAANVPPALVVSRARVAPAANVAFASTLVTSAAANVPLAALVVAPRPADSVPPFRTIASGTLAAVTVVFASRVPPAFTVTVRPAVVPRTAPVPSRSTPLLTVTFPAKLYVWVLRYTVPVPVPVTVRSPVPLNCPASSSWNRMLVVPTSNVAPPDPTTNFLVLVLVGFDAVVRTR